MSRTEGVRYNVQIVGEQFTGNGNPWLHTLTMLRTNVGHYAVAF